MGVIDIVLGGLILFGLVRGLWKGLFVEIASLLALVLGIYGAIYFSDTVASQLQSFTEWNEKTLSITAFAITFILIVLGITLAGKALTKLANIVALGFINKILGAIFGALKMALILSVFLTIFDKMNGAISFIDQENIASSIFYEPIKSLAMLLFPNLLSLQDSLGGF